MNKEIFGLTPMTLARSAGALYLLIIVFGISGELLIRGNLIVAGNANATAANILASPGLFRAGFFTDTIMLLCDVAIAALFYQLLKPVNQTLAMMAAMFRLTQAFILAFNLLVFYAPMLLLDHTSMAGFNAEQRNSLAFLFLELHAHGYDLGLIFFGVSNLLLGYLIIRSHYFPIIFGYALQTAGLVYLTGSFLRFLAPEFISLFQPAYGIPLLVELSFCVYLLIKGIRPSDHTNAHKVTKYVE